MLLKLFSYRAGMLNEARLGYESYFLKKFFFEMPTNYGPLKKNNKIRVWIFECKKKIFFKSLFLDKIFYFLLLNQKKKMFCMMIEYLNRFFILHYIPDIF